MRRYYGVRLSDALAGEEDMLEVAHYAANLPRGGAVGAWYGGSLAITAETEALWEGLYYQAVAVADKPKKVKPRPEPVGIKDAERKREQALAKARRYRARRG